jgi:hypothetical protein
VIFQGPIYCGQETFPSLVNVFFIFLNPADTCPVFMEANVLKTAWERQFLGVGVVIDVIVLQDFSGTLLVIAYRIPITHCSH